MLVARRRKMNIRQPNYYKYRNMRRRAKKCQHNGIIEVRPNNNLYCQKCGTKVRDYYETINLRHEAYKQIRSFHLGKMRPEKLTDTIKF